MCHKLNWKWMFEQKELFEKWFRDNYFRLYVPSLFLGDEMNTVHFDWEKAYAEGTLEEHFRVALIDVNATPYAACSPAVRLFYQELHEYDDSWIVERIFAPATAGDAEILKESGAWPAASESHMPPGAFDVLCFSQQMIGEEVNLIGMLIDADIPVKSSERKKEDPIIIRGGASSFNPSVIMDVCDLFFLGEGEEILPELLSAIEKGRKADLSREEILLSAVQTWDCLWAPRFYEQRFSEDGELTGMCRLRDDVPEKIRYAFVRDLDECFILTKPIGVYNYPSRISNGVEITRGCEGQCGFCVSGFTYLPFRARSVKRVLGAAKEWLYHSGAPSTILASFCATSYPWLNTLIRTFYSREGQDFLAGLPRKIETMSLRMDTVNENVEFCSFLNKTGNHRIVFGVEGVSQRLRQVVSKNYTEEQILDTVRMVVRDGYKVIKFMFIAGLPGESREDWDELVELTRKIMEICREEGRTGESSPLFIYSWTPLKIFPFTPFQWLAPKVCREILPECIRERLEEMGVKIGFEDLEGEAPDFLLTQFLLRGDSRIQEMLIAMAEEGLRHHGFYDSSAVEYVRRWLKENHLPDLEGWLGEKNYETVFPWDFIDNGAAKEYLWKRFQKACRQVPEDSPRCLTGCSGCGACSPEHRKRMEEYRRIKKKDVGVKLDGLPAAPAADRAEIAPLFHAVLDFTFDELHSVIKGFYWEAELSRALNYAGIAYDRSTLKALKPFQERYDWAIGMNSITVAFAEKLPDRELIERINEHTAHMRVFGIRWMEGPVQAAAMQYEIPCPEGTDEIRLQEEMDAIMEKDTWSKAVEFFHDGRPWYKEIDLRAELLELSLKNHKICIKLRSISSPYHVYQALLGISWETAGRYRAERTEVTFAPQAVLSKR